MVFDLSEKIFDLLQKSSALWVDDLVIRQAKAGRMTKIIAGFRPRATTYFFLQQKK
jgi:hypothetical protein